ncbi:MAG: hypothetical protein HQ572_03920, partial [Candidatus Omnitrophica bacterium]|nr:hypothetical protein [Candidatus Omnitrophota bacterium]
VKFIFATTAAYKVIPTILSRCQRFNFRRLSSQDIIKKLKEIAKKEKINIEEAALYTIIRAASGSMRDAESLIDQLATYCKNNITVKDTNKVLGTIEQDSLYEFCQHVIGRDTKAAIKLINQIIDDGVDPSQFIQSLIEYFRAAMIIKEGKDLTSLVDLPKDEIEKLSKQTESLTTEDILYILYSLINTNYTIRRSSSQRIPLELLAVKLSRKESIVSLDEIMKRLNAIEKNAPANTEEAAITQTSNETPAKEEEVAMGEPGGLQQLEAHPELYRIREAMPKVIKNIRQEKIYIASCLGEGKIVSYKNNILTIGFFKSNTFHKESLEKPQNKKMIETQLAEALGSKTRVEFVVIKGDNTKNPDGQTEAQESNEEKKSPLKKALSEPIIKTAIDMFDGNIMKFM